MRNHYWTCSKFADWLRGTPKGEAKTSEGWDEWHKLAGQSKFRYWLAEEGLDYAQKIVFWIPDTLYSIKYYINNRWVTRTHSLTAHARDIKPGTWCDVGHRFLPCLFNELVDFVEIELAWWQIAWNDDDRTRYKVPFWATGWFRWRSWRCQQAGLDSLEWQRKLTWDTEYADVDVAEKYKGKPTPQAEKAQEILDLYTWWTVTRPARPDPHEASGWSAYCDAKRDFNDGRLFGSKTTPELEKQSKKSMKLLHKMEADFEKEDEAMMIRLIKVRHGLWT
jgi:hypothetical protein